jgi:hypothetical protein
MRLRGAESTEFEMKIAGYEFPHDKQTPYDSDWLKIHVDVTHPRGAWSKTDPCLLTFELSRLINWLRSIADECPEHAEVGFMEPELWFKWLGNGKNVLRIYLEYALRPSWSPFHGKNEEEELFVEFEMTPKDLGSFADYLSKELKRFPIRVGESKQGH